MDNLEITALLNSCPETKKHFQGVYASDTLPSKPLARKRPCSYICNLESIDKPGTHWVAFYVPRRGPIEYFDSYGGDLPSLFHSFVDCNGYIYNTRCLQNIFSAVCGQYVIYYLWQRGLCASMDDALKLFSACDPVHNDALVNHLVEEHFDVDLDIFDVNWQIQNIFRLVTESLE